MKMILGVRSSCTLFMGEGVCDADFCILRRLRHNLSDFVEDIKLAKDQLKERLRQVDIVRNDGSWVLNAFLVIRECDNCKY